MNSTDFFAMVANAAKKITKVNVQTNVDNQVKVPDDPELRPKAELSLIKKGQTYSLSSSDLPTAISHLQEALLKNPHQPEWVFEKLGEMLLKTKQYDEAKTIFEQLIQKYPQNKLGHISLNQIKQFDEAKTVFENFIQESQKNKLRHVSLTQTNENKINKESDEVNVFLKQRKEKMKYGNFLRETGKYVEAEKHFQNLLKQYPDSKDILVALAFTAKQARQYDLSAQRWEALTQKFPEMIQFKRRYIESLLETLEFERAQSYFDEQVNINKISTPDFLILQVYIYRVQQKWEDAIATLDQLRKEYPNNLPLHINKVQLLLKLFKSDKDTSLLDESLAILKTLQQKKSGNEKFQHKIQCLLIKTYILANQNENALHLISQLPDTDDQQTMEYQAWRSHMQENEDKAKVIWQKIQKKHYIPQIQSPDPGSLQRTDTNILKIDNESIIVFSVVRNERWRLPWFLDYYRSLGVNHFFFVDNNSDDGTTSYLHEQDDVYVFWTKNSYAGAFSGMQWINELVKQYGHNCWCMYLDVDEGLIFPGVEKKNLRDLTDYMARKGHEAFSSFMLDMYAPEIQPHEIEKDYIDFISEYPLFDNNYQFINSIFCPYQFVSGGVRRQFQIHENLTKTPIIRGGKGIKFLMSSHQITPAKVSDITGVLLHFKLAGDFQKNFEKDLLQNTRMASCKYRHLSYVQKLQELGPNASLINNKTEKYISSEQLLTLGFLKTSPEFEAKPTK